MQTKQVTRLVTLSLLCFSLFSPVLHVASAGQERDTGESALMLSEVTLDRSPGTQGSWVEIYNTANKEVPLDDVAIFCYGDFIYSFRKHHSLPAKALLLIRFSAPDNPRLGMPSGLERTKRGIVYVKSEKEANVALGSRTPGCCALVSRSEGGNINSVLDYLQWGYHNKLTGKSLQVRKKAVKAGLWRQYRQGLNALIIPEERKGRLRGLFASLTSFTGYGLILGYCQRRGGKFGMKVGQARATVIICVLVPIWISETIIPKWSGANIQCYASVRPRLSQIASVSA